MIKLTRGERIFAIFNYVILGMVTFTFVYPFLLVIGTSLATEMELIARKTSYVIIPRKPTLAAYEAVATSTGIYRAYAITIFRVIVGTGLNLFFTSLLAYGLSKRNLRGRIPLTFYVFITMIFSGGLIPHFLLVSSLGLRNTVWVLVIPNLIFPFYMFLLRNFFQKIPDSLSESAFMDGASPLTVLLKIIIPLSVPALITIGMFYGVFHWNAWFDAHIYINDHKKYPLQIILRDVLTMGMAQDLMQETMDIQERPPTTGLQAAVIIWTTIPILMVYPWLQRYFVKGLHMGAIKG